MHCGEIVKYTIDAYVVGIEKNHPFHYSLKWKHTHTHNNISYQLYLLNQPHSSERCHIYSSEEYKKLKVKNTIKA